MKIEYLELEGFFTFNGLFWNYSSGKNFPIFGQYFVATLPIRNNFNLSYVAEIPRKAKIVKYGPNDMGKNNGLEFKVFFVWSEFSSFPKNLKITRNLFLNFSPKINQDFY